MFRIHSPRCDSTRLRSRSKVIEMEREQVRDGSARGSAGGSVPESVPESAQAGWSRQGVAPG